MNRTLLAATAIFIAYGLGNASAADLPVYKAPPPVAAPYSWTGFYVGGDIGALWTHSGAGMWEPTTPTANPLVDFGEFPMCGTPVQTHSHSASFRTSAFSKRTVSSLEASTSGTIGNSRPRGLRASRAIGRGPMQKPASIKSGLMSSQG